MRQVRIPEKNYNKKIDHDLGIPLQDDYFYDEPEEIIEINQVEGVESEAKPSEKPETKKEKRYACFSCWLDCW